VAGGSWNGAVEDRFISSVRRDSTGLGTVALLQSYTPDPSPVEAVVVSSVDKEGVDKLVPLTLDILIVISSSSSS